MERLIEEIEVAIANGLYYSALMNALIVPDICSALETESGQTNGAKYKAWFDRYCAEKYGERLSGEAVYKIRCALLHQGKLNHDNPQYERILFQIPSSDGNIFHNNIMNKSLNLNLEIFIEDIINGYHQWRKEHGDDDFVKQNLKQSINHYPNGFPPFIVGVPLIC